MYQRYIKSLLKEDTECRIALIATYPRITEILSGFVEGTKIKLTNIHAHFEEAAKIAKSIENDVDVILTRGGTGHFIKQAVSVPVVNIPISPYDLVISVSKLPENIKKIGFVNYARPIFGEERIEGLYNKEITQYTFTDFESLLQGYRDAKRDGCQVVFGGATGREYGLSLGLNCVEIVSGRESIYQALTNAVEIVYAKSEERKQAVRLKAAFDSLNEGIAINDEKGNFTLFNDVGQQLFHLNQSMITKSNISSEIIGKNGYKAFTEQREELNYLQDVYEKAINTSHFPIFIKNEYIGQVSTFQDVTKIQYLESKIRNQMSKRGFYARYTFDDIIGKSQCIKDVKEQARLFAQVNAAVFISGESGVGKELFAHGIHNASPRQSGPFVAVNCAAIPEQLLESELFGYAPGAFTGANKNGKQGLFEMAHNGTIFLDEIGEIPKYMQARLLRVLQEKEVMRIGDDKIIPVNCRIISATNKPLLNMVKKGTFREDLYYRLNILCLEIPPLRERGDDVTLLANYFFMRNNLPQCHMESAVKIIQDMKGYDWPGNIRELNNTCLRITALLGVDSVSSTSLLKRNIDATRNGILKNITLNINGMLTLKEAVTEAEKQYILAILNQTGNNQTQAAKRLGLGRTTLWRKMQDIEDPENKNKA